MSFLRNREWRTFPTGRGWIGSWAWAFADSPSGEVYVTTFDNRIARFDGNRFEELPKPPTSAQRIFPYVDDAGVLWIVNDRFIGKFVGGAWKEVIPCDFLRDQDRYQTLVFSARRARDGSLWIASLSGLRKYRDGELVAKWDMKWTIPAKWSLYEDREHNVWISSFVTGLYRFSPEGKSRHFTTADGLSYNHVRCVFEDQENNLWIGMDGGGLQRLKHLQLKRWGREDGVPDKVVKSISIDKRGNIVVGTWGEGVFRMDENGIVHRVQTQGGSSSSTLDICRGTVPFVTAVIIDRQDRIWLLTPSDNKNRLEFYILDDSGCHKISIKCASTAESQGGWDLFMDSLGKLWIANNPVVSFDGRRIETYDVENKEKGVTPLIFCFTEDARHGTIWAGSDHGLYRLRAHSFVPVPNTDELNQDVIMSLLATDTGDLWVGTSDHALAYFRNGHVIRLNDKQGLPVRRVASLLTDSEGFLWLESNLGVLRIAQDELQRMIDATIQKRQYNAAFQIFDLSDGLPSLQFTAGATKDMRGRFWFGTVNGIFVIDPEKIHSLPSARQPVIETVLVDGRNAGNGWPSAVTEVEVSPQAQNFEIHYAGLSLAAPQKVRFRYKVENYDRDWLDAGTRTSAYYAKLAPGKYRFLVQACNGDAMWSDAAMCNITVLPHFYQTWFFRATCLAVALLLVRFLYQFHFWRIRMQLRVRFEERDAERTRIAQQLHDTLLQDIAATSMQLQAAANQLQSDPNKAEQRLETVMERLDHAMQRSRETIRGLRSLKPADDLDEELSRTGHELLELYPVQFQMSIVGKRRPLKTGAREELYEIACEGLRNAFQHSKAKSIAVTVEYLHRGIRLRIRDDGTGIGENLLKEGREGHFGLAGMRERATRLGANLALRSQVGNQAGTELEITLAAKRAFDREPSRFGLMAFIRTTLPGRLTPRGREPAP